MLGSLEQTWVTFVLTEEQVSKALVLCCSLRRAHTTRKISAIVSSNLSSKSRLALQRGFDLLFDLREEENVYNLEAEEFARIYAVIALRVFKTCAYLSPSIIALQNCDDIFDVQFSQFLFPSDFSNTSIFLFKPSLKNFDAVMEFVKRFKTNKGNFLRRWAEKTFKITGSIDEKYLSVMRNEKTLLRTISNMSLVRLVDYPEECDVANLKNSGILGQLVATHFTKILTEDVLPLKGSSTPNPRSTQFILNGSKEPIAIVGMSCRHPGANNMDEFWDLLIQDRDGISNPPAFRWSREQVSSMRRPNARKVNAGFLKNPVDEFDAKFFGISPSEVVFIDPQHRLLHELAWEALEDACIDPQSLRGSPGSVFMGSWTNEYKEIVKDCWDDEFYRTYMGNSIGAAAARISSLLGLTGPCVATESGCSSAMVGVHLACRALNQGDTDLALACGVNLFVNPFDENDMSVVVSPDGRCRTFSEDANGYGRAEGGGVLVLKRLSDALKDEDNIWGLIRGSAVAQEGPSNSLGTPTVECEALAMKDALLDADIEPYQVSYVEAHGTGTVVGDPLEVAAIAEAYSSPNREEPLVIGLVKTNVGHTESCSGITGIMKVLLAMKYETIPRHRNFSRLNPSIDLTAVPAVIPLEHRKWNKISGKPRLAGVSSFGITGTDSHVILEEPPQTSNKNALAADVLGMRRPLHIIKLSAKTQEALHLLLEKYKDALGKSEDFFADICFSANTGRANFPIKAAIIAKDSESAIQAINKRAIFVGEGNPETETIGKICFLFTGQTHDMHPGIGKSLYDNSPVFRMHMDYCDEILKKLYDIKIRQILWSQNNMDTDTESNKIGNTQKVCNFCIEYALYKLWESWGVKPDYVLGHRMGEFGAAVCGGILSPQDALTLLVEGSPGNRKVLVLNEKDGVTCDYISGTTGNLMEKPGVNAEYWAQHAKEIGNFLEAKKTALKLGCKTFIQIGTHSEFSELSMMNKKDKNEVMFVPSLKRNEEDWTTILNSVAKLYVKGVEIDWNGIDMFYSRKKVRLPYYPFIGKRFWPDLDHSKEDTVHPLIGSAIENASTTKLFQCGLTLDKNEYLMDHRIGNSIIFPGACYLEMCMVAGLATMEGSSDFRRTPSRHMKVENLIISAPLVLQESETCQIQTVVDFVKPTRPEQYGDNIAIKIFHRVNSEIGSKWLTHAEATFSPIPTAEDKVSGIGKEHFHDILSKPSQDENVITQLYEKLSSLGLKFGPRFKSLKKMWQNSDGTMLSQVRVPSTPEEQLPQYILHPIILDAMIQAVMLPNVKSIKGKKLLVPIKVGKFVWISNVTMNESDDRFIYVTRASKKGKENVTAFLLDSGGQLLAKMWDVEFVETSVKTVEALLEQQVSKMPQIWEETWRPQVGPWQGTHDNMNLSKVIGTEFDQMNRHLYWLVFHEKTSPVSNFILEQLPLQAKRKVIVVQSGVKFMKENSTHFMIRPDSEADLGQLFEAICGGNGGIALEGIVYCWSLNSPNPSQEIMLQPFLYLSKRIIKLREALSGLKLIVLTKGVAPLEDNDLSFFHVSTIWGFVKSLQVEQIDMNCRCVDISTDESEAGMLKIFYELWGGGNETQVAFNGKMGYVPKMTALKPSTSALKLPPGSDRFQLILPESNSIADLEFEPLEPKILEKGEIEIQVKSTALNFKDVLNILKPEFGLGTTVGIDFAGVVHRAHPNVSKWKVGDRVFGVNISGNALPSHVTLNENYVLPIPDSMTFSEASTLPTVAATGYHCLIYIAKIQSKDTVLIHTASGGVGLCAIQICKFIGATIIATAGSERKQNYLKSLGIQHVFNSRTLKYSDEILEVTNGRGVDVVLNSLTGDGFKEATLKACAPGARFVEMSILHTWNAEEVKELRPDVQYSIVDLFQTSHSDWRILLEKLWEFLEKGIVTPIPYVRFDAVNVREALQFMQKGKHIGKIVCIMPETKLVNGNRETHTPMFHDNSTYLITGGLGGIGFEVCKWMLKMGAKHIMLGGRQPPNSSTEETILALNTEHSSKVTPVQLDVSDFEQCRHLISFVIPSLNFPPLKGIMHAAGALRDALIENQTWDSLSAPLRSKVTGTLNLHELTKTIPTLEHFVLFSSVVSIFGSPGQSNYSAGNHFEDTFAHYRNSIGLPATTINWGPWGEVGMGTEFDAPGLKPISNLQGISALEYALKSHRTQTIVLNVESFAVYSKFFPKISTYLDDSTWKNEDNKSSDQSHVNYDEFWEQYDNIKCQKEKLEMMKTKVRFILQNILKLDSPDDIGDTVDFHELGVDSLIHVEIRNALQMLVGERAKVSTSVLMDSSNISVLTEAIAREVEGMGLSEDKIKTTEEITQLIREDCLLPEHITAGVNQERIQVSDISVVLVTGVTGKMGPHVLKDLSQNPQIKQIICLLRSRRNISPEARLRNILEERQLLPEIDMNKVSCIVGDVASPQLGLQAKAWEQLCNDVDAVFHFSALVRHTDLYRREETGNGTRAVNVGGLKNILDFCCSGRKLKHVFNASTLLSVSALDQEGNLSEDWPEPNDFDGVTHLAYPISRFIGDMLMKEAVTRRGIPGKVFRFPFISGDSKTGQFVLEQNHLMLRYLFIMKTGIMASVPMAIPVLPIDVAVKLSMDIFFNSEAPNDIYNIINKRPDPDQEFVSIAKRLGHEIKIVSLAEFSEKVMKSPGDTPLALFKDLYENEEVFMTIFDSVPALKQWMLDKASKKDFYVSKKVGKLLPQFYDTGHGRNSSMEYIYNDLVFAKKHGLLKKFGL